MWITNLLLKFKVVKGLSYAHFQLCDALTDTRTRAVWCRYDFMTMNNCPIHYVYFIVRTCNYTFSIFMCFGAMPCDSYISNLSLIRSYDDYSLRL